jgi:putative flippase GtrA
MCYIPKLFVYSTIGVLNTVTDFLVFVLLTSGLGYHYIPANMVSYSVGVILSFIMNRKFTFRAFYYILIYITNFLDFLW